MSRQTFVYREGLGVIPKEDASPLPGSPSLIRDQMDPTWHPANGQMYDSKSAFRQATKAAGCIEVGNEPLVPRTPRPRLSKDERVRDIKRGIEQLRSR